MGRSLPTRTIRRSTFDKRAAWRKELSYQDNHLGEVKPYSQTASVASTPSDPDRADLEQFRRERLGCLLEAELAAMMGIAIKTLRNWRSSGLGPRWTKFGRKILYPTTGLESYLGGNLNATTSKERTVGVPIQNRRSAKGVSANRLGGHRTKQEKSRAA